MYGVIRIRANLYAIQYKPMYRIKQNLFLSALVKQFGLLVSAEDLWQNRIGTWTIESYNLIWNY